MTIENKVQIGMDSCPAICPAELRKGYKYTRHTYEFFLPIADPNCGWLDADLAYYYRVRVNMWLQSLVDLLIIEGFESVGDGWWLVETITNAPIAWLEFIGNTFRGDWRVSHPFAHYVTSKGAE